MDYSAAILDLYIICGSHQKENENSVQLQQNLTEGSTKAQKLSRQNVSR